MTTTQAYLQTLTEARTRFTNLLKDITEEALTKKLVNTKNSAGFLIRHIADVELLFSKNVFGATDVKVHAKTVAAQHDTGEWTNLKELLDYQQEAFSQLKTIIEKQTEEDWQQSVTTKEFGTKTKAEAIGRIISHTAYHAGQLAIILKYAWWRNSFKNTVMKNSNKIYPSGAIALGFFLLLGICKPVNVNAQGNAQTKSTCKVTFIELGSVRCKPCIAMQPIIKSIETKYGSQVKVVFHDVWTPGGKEAAKQYTFNVIPTQLFFDENGKEYFRHEGYFPEDELVKVLQQKGVK